MKHPQYIGVFLTSQSKRALLREYPPTHPTVHADHVTLVFQPTNADMEKIELGVLTKLKVLGYYEDDKGQAIKVALPPELARFSNRTPHITISTAAGVAPAYSNTLIQGKPKARGSQVYTGLVDGSPRRNKPQTSWKFPLGSLGRVAARYLQADAGNDPQWGRIPKELAEFNKGLQRLKKLETLSDEQLAVELKKPATQRYWDAFSKSVSLPLFAAKSDSRIGHTLSWVRRNFGLKGHVAVQDAMYNVENRLSVLEAPDKYKVTPRRAAKNAIQTFDIARKVIQGYLNQAGPERLSYQGFKIRNDNFAKPQLRKAFDALDYLVAAFRKRGVEKLLTQTIKHIVLLWESNIDPNRRAMEYRPDKSVGIFLKHFQQSQTGRLTSGKFIHEAIVHELGHHVHLSFLPPDAKAEWDAGWSPVDTAQEKLRQSYKVTLEDRKRFFTLIKNNGWDPKKAGRKLKGIDRMKFLGWLYSPAFNRIISTPGQVRLTEYGRSLFEFFKDPDAWARKKLIIDDPEELKKQTKKLYQKKLDVLFLTPEWTQNQPLDAKLVEKIRKEDKSVAMELDKLELPSDYARTNVKEDFAETFTAFMLNPAKLSKQARFRMQRALSLSGLYGKPLMRMASWAPGYFQRHPKLRGYSRIRVLDKATGAEAEAAAAAAAAAQAKLAIESPSKHFTEDLVRGRTKPPRYLFHFTRSTEKATSIVKSSLKPRGHLSLSENPAMSGPQGPMFVLDTRCIQRKGIELEPYLQQRSYAKEAEWRTRKEIPMDCVVEIGWSHGLQKRAGPALAELEQAAKLKGIKTVPAWDWTKWWPPRKASLASAPWAQGYFQRHPKLRGYAGIKVLDKATGASSSHGEARQQGKEIWLFPKFYKLDTKTQDWVFTHEIGHYVLSKYGLASFIKKAASHGIDVWDTSNLPYGQFNMDEAFADCFAAYFLNPTELKTRYPVWFDLLGAVLSKVRTARAIPIDKLRLRAVTKRIVGLLIQAFKVAARTKGDVPIRWREIWAKTSHDLPSVLGKDLSVDIVVAAGKDTRHGPYVQSGGFGHRGRARTPIVILKLNGSYTAREYLQAAESGILNADLYSILIHEMTHAVDVETKARYETGSAGGSYTTPDLKKYYNDPKEVRAFMQQVVDEVLGFGGESRNVDKILKIFGPRGGEKRQRGVETLLKNSETWGEIQKHLTPSNRKKILKAVYQALVAEGHIKQGSRLRTADLAPPLGYPGGPCHVVKRIDDAVSNPRTEDHLIDLVERGVSLSNPEAAKVYHVESETGVWKFKRMNLLTHVQYRMDLRGITVPEVRLAIGSFFRAYNNAKSRKKDKGAQGEAQKWDMAMLRREPINWTDPKIGLTVVFAADARRNVLDVVTVYWKGQKDPRAPGACRVARAYTQRFLRAFALRSLL